MRWQKSILAYSFFEEFITGGRRVEIQQDQWLWSEEQGQVTYLFNATPIVRLRKLTTQSGLDWPVIEVSYSVDDLSRVIQFITLVKQRKIQPRVFLLKENTPDPEVVVSFEIIGVPRFQIARLLGEGAAAEHVKDDSTVSLITSGGACVQGWQLRRFLAQYSRYKEVYLVVSEATSKYSLMGKLDPVQYFTIKHFERTRPSVRMY